VSVPDQSAFDPERSLPSGKEWFSIRWLARHWNKSAQHVINLVDSGEIKTSVDLRGKGSKRSDTNIPRSAVVDFLNRRKK
jgi:hypothetical protein